MPNYITSEGTVDLFGAYQLGEGILDLIGDNAAELSKRLESIIYFSDYIDSRDMIYKEAWVEAVNYLTPTVFNLVLSETLKAAAITGEYNYPIYLEYLVNAILANKELMVSFEPTGDITKINVNMQVLGDIDQWAIAVTATRNALEIGQKEDMEARSEYWAYKVYATAREGLAVQSYSKKRKEPLDVTDKFSKLYEATVTTRLGFLADDTAPFWYLIENGNAPGSMPDSGGFPYPIVSPTRFVSKTEIAIAKMFELTLLRLLNKVMLDYANAIMNSYVKGAGKDQQISDMNKIYNDIHRITQDLLSREEVLQPIDASAINRRVTLALVRLDEFTRQGKRVKVLRGLAGTGFGGQFVKSPITAEKRKRTK